MTADESVCGMNQPMSRSTDHQTCGDPGRQRAPFNVPPLPTGNAAPKLAVGQMCTVFSSIQIPRMRVPSGEPCTPITRPWTAVRSSWMSLFARRTIES